MSEREMTEEEVEEKAFEMFPGNMVTGLSDNDWKVRLSSAEQYLQVNIGGSCYMFFPDVHLHCAKNL